jgi:transcriptional regulator with XRE-family HTH domain
LKWFYTPDYFRALQTIIGRVKPLPEEVTLETPLKRHREQLGMTSSSVAVALGITPSHYRRVEIGETGASPELARKIAAHFGQAVTEMQILYPESYLPAAEVA